MFMRKLTVSTAAIAVVVLLTAISDLEQDSADPNVMSPGNPEMIAKWAAFKQKNGDSWTLSARDDGTVRKVMGGRVLQPGDTPEKAAGFFLKNNLVLFVGNPDSVEFAHTHSHKNVMGAAVRFAQKHEGLRVRGGEALVNLDARGSVISAASSFENIVTTTELDSAIDRDTAIDLALEAATVEGKLRGDIKAEFVLAERNGFHIPAWEIAIPAFVPLGDWLVLIDGRDGEVFEVSDIRRFFDAPARVFDPNPIVTMQDDTLSDADDADVIPEQAYVDVTLTGLEKNAEDVLILRGLNVHCQAGVVGNVSLYEDVAAVEGEFNFSRNNRKFEPTMGYHHIDATRRYLLSLGITSAVKSDGTAIKARFHGDSDYFLKDEDQSFYSPMTESLWFGDGGVDDAEDAEVIVHEYGHAIQDFLVPGFGHTSESGAMGEGFGDYLASSVFALKHEEWDVGKVFDWDGITWGGRRVDSTRTYSDYTGDDVHIDGMIWAATLWSIREALGAEIADTLILSSHNFLLPSATFYTGAEAILQADAELYDSEHAQVIQSIIDSRNITEGGGVDDGSCCLQVSVGDSCGALRSTREVTFSPLARAFYSLNHNGPRF
ncbi:M36 family metallopeptidase [Candidatus Hydrogenedentota bacterium]